MSSSCSKVAFVISVWIFIAITIPQLKPTSNNSYHQSINPSKPQDVTTNQNTETLGFHIQLASSHTQSSFQETEINDIILEVTMDPNTRSNSSIILFYQQNSNKYITATTIPNIYSPQQIKTLFWTHNINIIQKMINLTNLKCCEMIINDTCI